MTWGETFLLLKWFFSGRQLKPKRDHCKPKGAWENLHPLRYFKPLELFWEKRLILGCGESYSIRVELDSSQLVWWWGGMSALELHCLGSNPAPTTCQGAWPLNASIPYRKKGGAVPVKNAHLVVVLWSSVSCICVLMLIRASSIESDQKLTQSQSQKAVYCSPTQKSRSRTRLRTPTVSSEHYTSSARWLTIASTFISFQGESRIIDSDWSSCPPLNQYWGQSWFTYDVSVAVGLGFMADSRAERTIWPENVCM